MEIAQLLADGFAIALQPLNIGLVVLGVVLGLFIGAMPRPRVGERRRHPAADDVSWCRPTGAMIFLAAIYYGRDVRRRHQLDHARHSGRLDRGSDDVRRPAAGDAEERRIRRWMAAAVASFIGGTISVVLFTGFAPPLAAVALAFGSPEEFALMMLAFATFVGLSGDDIPKTLFSIFIGLALSAVGSRHRERRAAADLLRHSGVLPRHQLPGARHRDLRHRRDPVDAGDQQGGRADLPGDGERAAADRLVPQAQGLESRRSSSVPSSGISWGSCPPPAPRPAR